MKFLIVFFFPIQVCFSQTLGDNTNYGRDLLLTKPKIDNIIIEGNPYIDKNFMPATISKYNSEVNLRYNASKDEMEYMKNGEVYYLNKIDGQQINFKNGRIFICTKYDFDDNLFFGYLQMLTDLKLKVALLKRVSIGVSDGVDGLNSYQESKSPTYQKK